MYVLIHTQFSRGSLAGYCMNVKVLRCRQSVGISKTCPDQLQSSLLIGPERPGQNISKDYNTFQAGTEEPLT